MQRLHRHENSWAKSRSLPWLDWVHDPDKSGSGSQDDETPRPELVSWRSDQAIQAFVVPSLRNHCTDEQADDGQYQPSLLGAGPQRQQ